MRIQFVSDLHLEFPATGGTLPLENVDGKTDLLVLAGDICVGRRAERFRPFFQHCADIFPRVVYIAGNHEFYHGDIEETHDNLRAAVRGLPNVSYLDRELIDLGPYQLFGATLWTDCNKGDPLTAQALAFGMNDYRLIQWKSRKHWKLRPQDTAEIHAATLGALTAAITVDSKPTIVVSHMAPSPQSVHPRYANDDRMNGGYYSDLRLLLAELRGYVPLWIHGHTHSSFDYDEMGVRIVCNPRGYVTQFKELIDAENAAFDPRKVIELP